MKLIDKINQDLISAQKEREELILSTLRVLKSEIKNKEIEKRKELNDDEICQVINSEIKKRKDSISEFKKGNRPDLAKKEKDEIKILIKYQPKQLSSAEIEKLVDQTISKIGAKDVSDMGKVMGAIMPKITGKADGAIISDIVRIKLTKK